MATMSSIEDESAKQPSNQRLMVPQTMKSSPSTVLKEDDTIVISKASSFDGSAPDCQKPAMKSTKKRKFSTGSGRWTEEEHKAFLVGLSRYGREWKRVAQGIPTRTSAQVRSHAQKYFAKLSKHHEVSESVRLRAEQIMANPAAAELEVQETLRQLKERYRELKQKQEAEQQQQNDAELIAVNVLRGGLRSPP